MELISGGYRHRSTARDAELAPAIRPIETACRKAGRHIANRAVQTDAGNVVAAVLIVDHVDSAPVGGPNRISDRTVEVGGQHTLVGAVGVHDRELILL